MICSVQHTALISLLFAIRKSRAFSPNVSLLCVPLELTCTLCQHTWCLFNVIVIVAFLCVHAIYVCTYCFAFHVYIYCFVLLFDVAKAVVVDIILLVELLFCDDAAHAHWWVCMYVRCVCFCFSSIGISFTAVCQISFRLPINVFCKSKYVIFLFPFFQSLYRFRWFSSVWFNTKFYVFGYKFLEIFSTSGTQIARFGTAVFFWKKFKSSSGTKWGVI